MARNTVTNSLIDVNIGKKIRELRIVSGWSRKQLGVLIDVTHQQLQKYEKGTNRICPGRLYSIARAFKVSISYFFEDIENYIPTNDNHTRRSIELFRMFTTACSEKQQMAIMSLMRSIQTTNCN